MARMMNLLVMMLFVPSFAASQFLPVQRSDHIVLNEFIPDELTPAEQRLDFRVIRFPNALPEGTVVSPYREEHTAVAAQDIRCAEACFVYLIDLYPQANWAHPSITVVVDAESLQLMHFRSTWWPLINAEPRFHTVTDRRRPAVAELRGPAENATSGLDFDWIASAISEIPPGGSCSTRAVLVCGDYEEYDQDFFIDTLYMYLVLRIHGVSDDNILWFCDGPDIPGIDVRSFDAHVVVQQTKDLAVTVDSDADFVFFYSGHGEPNKLRPNFWSSQEISATTLDSVLDGIPSDRTLVVLGACNSGSFIGAYSRQIPRRASENELTGDGETDRVVVCSAATDTLSRKDEDNLKSVQDPNSFDIGTESLSGGLECLLYHPEYADGCDTLQQASQASWSNDLTRLVGVNFPVADFTGVHPTQPVVRCDRVYQVGLWPP